MRHYLSATAAAATVAFFSLLAPDANAMTVGTASGIKQGLAETSMVEPVVRVCRTNMFTGRRVCWIDRSRPPTVCHRIRGRDGRTRLDCY
jgi:hypothetical protein